MNSSWRRMSFSEAVEVNPRRKIPRGMPSPFIDMATLPTELAYVRPVRSRSAGVGGSRFANGDTLFARITPCTENGKTGMVKGLAPGQVGTGSTEFIVLGPRQAVTLAHYVYYMAKNPAFRSFAISQMRGTSGRQRVPARVFEDYEVPVPPLIEQQKIVAILSSVDEVIEKTQAVIDQVQLVKRGMMGNLLPQAQQGRNAPCQSKAAGSMPTRWKVKPLGRLVEVLDRLRKPLNKRERNGMRGPYPYYGANGVLDHVSQWIFDEPLLLMAEDGGYFEEFQTRPIAYTVTGKCWVNNHAHVLRTNSEVDLEWLFYSLVHKDLRPFINSGTRAKLNQRDLVGIPIAVPPLPEQRKIAAIFSSVDAFLQKNRAAIEELRIIKSALMSVLLTGELRVTPDPKPE